VQNHQNNGSDCGLCGHPSRIYCPHTHRVGEGWESGMEAQRIATCVKKVCSPQHSGHHPCGVLVIREQQHLSAGLSLKAAIYLLAPPSRFLALFRIQRSALYRKETLRARYDRSPGLVLLSRVDSPTIRTDELPQTTFSLGEAKAPCSKSEVKSVGNPSAVCPSVVD